MFDTQHTPKTITLDNVNLKVVSELHVDHNQLDSMYTFTAEVHVNNVLLPVKHVKVDPQMVEPVESFTGKGVADVKLQLIEDVFDGLFEAWRESDTACQILGEPDNSLDAGPWEYEGHIQADIEPVNHPFKGFDLSLNFFGVVYHALMETGTATGAHLEQMLDYHFKYLFDHLRLNFSESLLTTG